MATGGSGSAAAIRSLSVADQVFAFMRAAPPGEWHTLSQVIDATGLTPGQVNGVLYDCVHIGVVELERPARPGRREQRYRWRA